MNKVELNDQTLDSYDVLRRELKTRWPDWKNEVFKVCDDGTVIIRLDIGVMSKTGLTTKFGIESRYIIATFKRGKWKLTGDID